MHSKYARFLFHTNRNSAILEIELENYVSETIYQNDANRIT